MASWEDFLQEIANPKRLQILQLLARTPTTFTDLTKQLDISSSETSRHLARLTDNGFIDKRHPSREFEVTPLGEISVQLFAPIQFIFTHGEFFRHHTLEELPPEFYKDLDALQDALLITQIGEVMQKMGQIVKGAEEWAYFMVDQAFPFGKPGLKAKYIVPPTMAARRPEVEEENEATDGRYLETLPVSMVLVDRGSWMIFFPDLEKKLDFSTGFLIAEGDTIGKIFLQKLWDYFWDKGSSSP